MTAYGLQTKELAPHARMIRNDGLPIADSDLRLGSGQYAKCRDIAQGGVETLPQMVEPTIRLDCPLFWGAPSAHPSELVEGSDNVEDYCHH